MEIVLPDELTRAICSVHRPHLDFDARDAFDFIMRMLPPDASKIASIVAEHGVYQAAQKLSLSWRQVANALAQMRTVFVKAGFGPDPAPLSRMVVSSRQKRETTTTPAFAMKTVRPQNRRLLKFASAPVVPPDCQPLPPQPMPVPSADSRGDATIPSSDGPSPQAQRISPQRAAPHLNTAGQFRDGGQVACGQWTETAMTSEVTRRLESLSKQLTENLMSAALCAKEIGNLARSAIDDGGRLIPSRFTTPVMQSAVSESRPFMDEATLCVVWKGRSLYLGHTVGFRLLARLARRPKCFITHLDLMRDVWDNEDMPIATIRSVVRHLRQRLSAGGMKDLSSAIRGHNGRYVLDL